LPLLLNYRGVSDRFLRNSVKNAERWVRPLPPWRWARPIDPDDPPRSARWTFRVGPGIFALAGLLIVIRGSVGLISAL
jgi:hypothetical protein